MVGHKDKHQWVATQGTIVDVRPGRHEHHYLIDARNQTGAMIQREVKHRSPQPYTVGSTVRVEISVLNEIRFDPNVADPLVSSMTVADQIAEASAAFDRPGAAHGPTFGRLSALGVDSTTFQVSFGSYDGTAKLGGMPDQMSGLIAGGIEGLASAIGAIIGDATHITGADGRQYQVDPDEMQRLTQALASSDTAEKLAAMKQLHRIRAAAMAQAAKPATDGSLGQVGGAALAGGAGAVGGAGVAGGRTAGGSVEDRLAKLEDLLSKGILTQSEYDAQRQRVIEGI